MAGYANTPDPSEYSLRVKYIVTLALPSIFMAIKQLYPLHPHPSRGDAERRTSWAEAEGCPPLPFSLAGIVAERRFLSVLVGGGKLIQWARALWFPGHSCLRAHLQAWPNLSCLSARSRSLHQCTIPRDRDDGCCRFCKIDCGCACALSCTS